MRGLASLSGYLLIPSPSPEDTFLGATDPRAGRLEETLGEATHCGGLEGASDPSCRPAHFLSPLCFIAPYKESVRSQGSSGNSGEHHPHRHSSIEAISPRDCDRSYHWPATYEAGSSSPRELVSQTTFSCPHSPWLFLQGSWFCRLCCRTAASNGDGRQDRTFHHSLHSGRQTWP